TAQLLAAFGVFAIGYLMRPIGGAVIGHIGDRLGRRTALTFSVAAMAVPTFLIGLLPGYATLGIAAPILFTLLRMMQGLSTGGEYTSSLVFLVERAPPGHRGLPAAFSVFNGVGFYITFVYIASWLQTVDHMPLSRALEINTISMCLMPAMFLGTAWLTDRVGRKPLLMTATIAGFFAAVPLFMLM